VGRPRRRALSARWAQHSSPPGDTSGIPNAVAAVLEWLGWTNVPLLAFNLLPALSLDGGRVLGALLWRVTGSLIKATRYDADRLTILRARARPSCSSCSGASAPRFAP
jgi:membrane-associated protease RseP (regulator of RpoE activity)